MNLAYLEGIEELIGDFVTLIIVADFDELMYLIFAEQEYKTIITDVSFKVESTRTKKMQWLKSNEYKVYNHTVQSRKDCIVTFQEAEDRREEWTSLQWFVRALRGE
jgi:hypothetical protein